MSQDRSFGPQEILQALADARARVEQERRERFALFGIEATCLWPCSRLFHEQSSLGPQWQAALSVEQVEQHTWNLAYRRYDGSPRVALPHPPALATSLEWAIRSRHSTSSFSAQPVTLVELAKLLEIGAGLTRSDTIPRRAAPSGGALYPVETYVLAFAVEELEGALYHYLPLQHTLERLRPLAGIEALQPVLPPGLIAARPALVIALTVVFERTQAKYLERGYRFALLEAGHLAQNFLLIAAALGLGGLPVGGYWDEPFNALLGLEPTQEAVLYAVLLGQADSAEQQVAAVEDSRISR